MPKAAKQPQIGLAEYRRQVANLLPNGQLYILCTEHTDSENRLWSLELHWLQIIISDII